MKLTLNLTAKMLRPERIYSRNGNELFSYTESANEEGTALRN